MFPRVHHAPGEVGIIRYHAARFGRTGATMEPGTQYRQQALAFGVGNHMTITAKYEDGVFKPLEDVTVNEGTIVEVHVPSYADRLKGKSRSVGDSAFFGMWNRRRTQQERPRCNR
jgi:predicted DNA-binding antitoxin AbrB/MazE fold protein